MPTLDENAEIIRKMINKENELLNHRFTWLNAIQALLFGGLGFVWQNDSIGFLTIVYSFIGLAVSFSGGLGVKIANNATKSLYEWWLEQDIENYNGPDVQGKPFKRRKEHELPAFLYPWNFLPWVFGLTWVFIGVYWLACWEAK